MAPREKFELLYEVRSVVRSEINHLARTIMSWVVLVGGGSYLGSWLGKKLIDSELIGAVVLGCIGAFIAERFVNYCDPMVSLTKRYREIVANKAKREEEEIRRAREDHARRLGGS